MKKLNEKNWKKFSAFDKDKILNIKTTNSSIDGIRLIDGIDKIIPYITRTDNSNGIARFVSKDNLKYGSDNGGCITVGLDTQTAFYQPYKFVTGQNVQIVSKEGMSEKLALFFVPVLSEQMRAKFNWGGNGATLGRMKKLDVILPVNTEDNPDYDYMEEYSAEVETNLLKRYKEYAEEQIEKLEYKEIPSLNEKEWRPIAITDLFQSFIPGKGKGLNHLRKCEVKGIDYIGATNRNNGVLCYIEENEYSNKMLQPGKCIGFIKNGDGAAGFAIYKEEQFVSTSDVLYGYAEWINRYTGLFFVVAQDMIEAKYSHGYKRNKQHLSGDKVMLPVDNEGKPDYKYMEQYTKNLILKKYKQYISFLDKKEA